MTDTTRRPLPLQGITVIELGMVLAGPFAGSLLADLGATVIKIEPPGTGDGARQMGPRKQHVALWWGVASRNKTCITLNLKDVVARGLFERLVAQADVVIENYRPGVLDRLGLGWKQLHAINQRLIMLSITGFGQTGPRAESPGFGKIAEGMSGLVSLTGDPEQNPLFVGYSLADTTAGLFGVYAINLALFRRDVQGAGGAHIDLALYEPMLRMMQAQFAMRRALGRAPTRRGSNNPHGWGSSQTENDTLFAFLQTQDGAWIEAIVPSGAGKAVRRLVGDDLQASAKTLLLSLASWARMQPTDRAVRELRGAGAKVVPVLDGLSLAQHDYFRQRGDVLPVCDPEAGSFYVTGFFGKHYQRPDDARAFASPALGAHNHEVFVRSLGLTEDEFSKLQQRGVI